MRPATRIILGIAILACVGAPLAHSATSRSSSDTLVIIFKDGHQKAFSTADVSRIDFKTPGAIVVTHSGHDERLSLADVLRIEFSPTGSALQPGRNHFVGKWKVGEGNGANFYIQLDRNGDARKSIGATHGTWVVVDGEARISWDDGWRDVIRRVGTKHEKVAYEPGKSLDEDPSNITDARRVEPQPI